MRTVIFRWSRVLRKRGRRQADGARAAGQQSRSSLGKVGQECVGQEAGVESIQQLAFLRGFVPCVPGVGLESWGEGWIQDRILTKGKRSNSSWALSGVVCRSELISC